MNNIPQEVTEFLQNFINLVKDSKASHSNPNTTFVDTRDLEVLVAEARKMLKE